MLRDPKRLEHGCRNDSDICYPVEIMTDEDPEIVAPYVKFVRLFGWIFREQPKKDSGIDGVEGRSGKTATPRAATTEWKKEGLLNSSTSLNCQFPTI